MNLVGTLAKVAVGVMVARGVGSLMKSRNNAQQNQGQNSSGGGLLGSLAGGGAGQQGAGGLAELLGGRTGGNKQQSGGATGDFGGLGGLLGGLAGAAHQNQGSGGLGGMLSNLMAGSGQQQADSKPYGLGGLLDSLGDSSQQTNDRGSLGGIFNDALAGRRPPQPEPNQNAQAEILLRAMINAAKSDGEIDQAEQAQIIEHLDDVTQDEIEFVKNEMAQPLDVNAFALSVPRELKQQVYLMSLLGIKLDSQAEAEYLDRLASELGIDSQQANHIHTQLGVPTLYA
jgi:uncharacterized membrane protein YebE (DUF533 family)